MRLCEYKNEQVNCKNWIASQDEEEKYCPLHLGIVVMKTENETKLSFNEATQSRFEHHLTMCGKMTDGELKAHILQLDSLLEDVKLRQQAAQHTRTKRSRETFAKLTPEQHAEIQQARDRTERTPRMTKEEKEIQNLMKKGLSREKAIILLGLE